MKDTQGTEHLEQIGGRLSCRHGGLHQPKQEALRQFSGEEEQHVRGDATFVRTLRYCRLLTSRQQQVDVDPIGLRGLGSAK